MAEINGYGTTSNAMIQRTSESKARDSGLNTENIEGSSRREGVEVILSSDQDQYTDTYESVNQSAARQLSSTEQRALDDLEYDQRTARSENLDDIETNEAD